MTRMWMVSPELLCVNHLLGEHKECHQLAGSLRKGRSIKGHVDKGQVDTSKLFQRHDVLAEELGRRGYNHKSPLDTFPVVPQGSVDVNKNLKDLSERCSKCRENISGKRK